ncbi:MULTISPECIES: hypothetical protein [unclassified Streptomyces]|uniref:hypothetical protein n=1 Tax=unclassified Streptomyces TaxID=2593676 RepID=UPI00324D7410
MSKKQRASMRDWLFVLACIAAVIDIGGRAVFDSSMIVRAAAIFGLVAVAFAVGTVFGRKRERRKLAPQGDPAPDISA